MQIAVLDDQVAHWTPCRQHSDDVLPLIDWQLPVCKLGEPSNEAGSLAALRICLSREPMQPLWQDRAVALEATSGPLRRIVIDGSRAEIGTRRSDAGATTVPGASM